MIPDKIYLFAQFIAFAFPYAFQLLGQRISAFFHFRAYKALPASETKNVVVIGGSFAGVQISKRLAATLPTGYRVVLVEKNSHLNYLFAFPRFSVVRGYERYAFIPYDGIAKGAPEGIFSHVRETAVRVTKSHVVLGSGEEIGYAYLVIATGTSSAMPSKVLSTDHRQAQAELRSMQDGIEGANKIAVIGGGAVGVELATDIKSFYPDKNVALIHSREQLLPSFGKRLHDHVVEVTTEMGIAVLLDERPAIPEDGGNTLELLNGKEEAFDLIIPCTGQRPNSSILATLSPDSISKQTSHILVKPTLQLVDESLPCVFAFGDVADTSGPKMARAAFYQSEIVLQNLISLIRNRGALVEYKPQISMEGAIKLTLGKTRLVVYTRKENGKELLVPMNNGVEDMGVKMQWRFYGANPENAAKGVEKVEA